MIEWPGCAPGRSGLIVPSFRAFARRVAFCCYFAVEIAGFNWRAAQRRRGGDVEYKFISGLFACFEYVGICHGGLLSFSGCRRDLASV